VIWEQVLRLLLAGVVGMAIGMEREWREKAAGFRTITLVALGAAAFMLSVEALPGESASRVVAGVATGVGFLGAGTILRERGQIFGLTTAAAVWMAAALGVAAGLGEYVLTGVGLVAALIVLLVLPYVTIENIKQDTRTYEVTYESPAWDPEELAADFHSAGLTHTLSLVSRNEDGITVVWQVSGKPAAHQDAIGLLDADDSVKRFSVTQVPGSAPTMS